MPHQLLAWEAMREKRKEGDRKKSKEKDNGSRRQGRKEKKEEYQLRIMKAELLAFNTFEF